MREVSRVPGPGTTSLRRPRVLVTGGSGFVGRCCLPLLTPDFEVHALSRRGRGATDGVTWHAADLCEASVTERVVAQIAPSHLLHLAWAVPPGSWPAAPEHLDWTAASLRLFQAFARAGGRRLVVGGSCAEYDWTAGVCHESGTPATPRTLYGAAKRAVGLVAERWAETSGLSLAWARIFFVYGPHEPDGRLVPTIARALLRAERAACTTGAQRRDYLYVRDVAEALTLLVRSDLEGVVNVGSGRDVAVRDLALAVAQRLGRPDLLGLGDRPGSDDDAPLVVADVRRLTGGLGWRPRYTLESGLDETIAWWRRQVLEPKRMAHS
jgi:nucleoside-diphosphate-sugar epimerase